MKHASNIQVSRFGVGNVLENQRRISFFIGEIEISCSAGGSTVATLAATYIHLLILIYKALRIVTEAKYCTKWRIEVHPCWNSACKAFLMIFRSQMRRFHLYPKISCVYFLFLRGKLIYIGQTVDLRSRMMKHNYGYLADSLRYIPCRAEKLEEYEKRLIKILKPLSNQQYNKPNYIKIPYKVPKWAHFYDRMMSFNEAIETGNHPWDKCSLKNHLHEAKKKFKYYYKTYGYKGTFLDTTITQHPF